MKTVLKKFDKTQMYLLKDDPGVSHTLLKSWKGRERAFMWVFMHELQKGDIFCDIGANLGYNTVRASEVIGRDARIIAIEPDEKNYKVLKMNVKLNKLVNAKTIKCGISDKRGIAKFYASHKSNLGSIQKHRPEHKSCIKIKTWDIAGLSDELGIVPTFYKMDIEGGEVAALKGMIPLFKRTEGRVRVIIEVHQTIFKKYKLNFAEQLEGIFNLGFTAKYVVSGGLPIPKLFAKEGYSPLKVFKTRGIYEGIANEHVLDWASNVHYDTLAKNKKRKTPRIVRAILLARD